MEEKLIGKITHYFNRIGVAVLELSDEIRVGDTIHIKGHTTDFTQKVVSMQIEHKPIEVGKPGDNIAIKVDDVVKEHDLVFKVIE
jgi:putative protease